MKELVIGGARSGKSRFAQSQAVKCKKKLHYLATAEAADDEMAERIRLHRAERGPQWTLIEEPRQLATALLNNHHQDNVIVIDCLTLWVTQCLLADCWESERAALMAALDQLNGDIIFVSNETGMGVVPLGELTRQFVDASGFLHQAIAAHCERVTLMVAGLPMPVKPVQSAQSS